MAHQIRINQGEENVVDANQQAFEYLVEAFSTNNYARAIELCEENDHLLIRKLPNNAPVLNELIMLVGRGANRDNGVIGILIRNGFPRSALCMKDSFGRTPLTAAVLVGSIDIARHIVGMRPELFSEPNDFGLLPLGLAIGSHLNDMANALYDITPTQEVWTMNNGNYGATLITKSIEVGNLDIALRLLRQHPKLIFKYGANGKTPLDAAARAPHLFRASYRHRFLPKFISNFLGPMLPLRLMDFEISGIELLIVMRNAIRATNVEDELDTVYRAFKKAIKLGNFILTIMFINANKTYLNMVYDKKGRNPYMRALVYRQSKVFSLIFWDVDTIKLSAIYWKDNDGKNLLNMVADKLEARTVVDPISKPALEMKRDLMWFKEVEELVPDLVKTSRNSDRKTPRDLFNENHKDLTVKAENWLKESASSWAIVGPLIITIMFAAAFQVPGGTQDTGYPVFLSKPSFKVYMVLVAASLFLATISVLKFLEILSSNHEEKDFLRLLMTYNVITGTLFLSLATMLVAFCMGLFLTLHGDLRIFLPIAVVATFLIGYIVSTKLPLLAESFIFLLFEKVPLNKWRTSIFYRNINHEVERIMERLPEEVAV